MRGIKILKFKSLFWTVFLLSCCFVILLNLMVVQLNNSNNLETLDHLEQSSIYRQISQEQQSQANRKSFSDSEDEDENSQNVKITERKPQALLDDSTLHKPNKIQYNSVHHITEQQKKNIELDYKISQLKKLVKMKQEESDNYEYEADIEKAVIEDDDVSDEDSYDEETKSINENVLKYDNFLKKPRSAKFIKPKLKFQEVPKSVQSVPVTIKPTNKSFVIRNVVEDGIYWSKEVVQLVPKGLTDDEMLAWRINVRNQTVKYLKLPTWNKCGRDKNRFVVLDDGTAMCARYRHPHNKLVIGEVMSFYLSKLLHMDNIPIVVLSKLNQTGVHWHNHDLQKADWELGQFVALIQWIPNMETRQSYVYMPKQILEAVDSKSVVDAVSLADEHLSPTVLSNLVQWGTMIIFDYLTGNYDRVASMQDGAFREKRPSILSENIRNLRKSLKTSKLWLIDNESGLLDAYDLLYKGGQNGNQFITFHKQMLQTMCIFEKPFVMAIKSLHKTTEPYKTLEDFACDQEPLLVQVPKDKSYDLFQKMFSKRLKDVYDWIEHCQSRQL